MFFILSQKKNKERKTEKRRSTNRTVRKDRKKNNLIEFIALDERERIECLCGILLEERRMKSEP